MKDLENRMKENYENREKHYLPRRTNTIIRVDGKNFSKYTKGFDKPYDHDMLRAMQTAMVNTAEEIQGLEFAYTQSDEISFYLRDDHSETTQAYLDGNVQKIASITASMVTAYFNQYMNNGKPAMFDARTFIIPDEVEVENYFIWRNMDAMRNAITTIGRHYLGHKGVYGKSNKEVARILEEDEGLDLNQPTPFFNCFKYGTMYHKGYDPDRERYNFREAQGFDFAHYRGDFVACLKGSNNHTNFKLHEL